MLDLTKLWSAEYLFGPNFEGLTRSDNIFLWLGIILIAISFGLKIYSFRKPQSSPEAHFLKRLFVACLTTGMIVGIWAVLRWQNIPWLSVRILVLLVWIGFIIWIGFIVKYRLFEYPSQRQLWEDEQTKNKYLP